MITRRIILLVDDDPMIRSLTSDSLETLGYTVLRASNGEGAVELLQKKGRIDLLITDIQMPGMDGMELAKSVNSVCPESRILFMSGSPFPGDGHFIDKPFTVDLLVSKVRDLLRKKAVPPER